MIHVSTIGVAGDTEGIFYYVDLDVGQGFNNPYEKSKFEAERLVERYRKKGLNILIVRPSMVIGHSRTGVTNQPVTVRLYLSTRKPKCPTAA